MNVTDEMVDVAARIAFPLNSMANPGNERIRAKIRTALEAALSHAAGQEAVAEDYWIGIVRRYRNPLQRFIRLHAQFDYDRDRNENRPRSAEDWAAVQVERALSGHLAPAPPSTSADRDALILAGRKMRDAMEMQEGREMETLHIAQPTARLLWDQAKESWDAAIAASSEGQGG